jgi:hypothetical protein
MVLFVSVPFRLCRAHARAYARASLFAAASGTHIGANLDSFTRIVARLSRINESCGRGAPKFENSTVRKNEKDGF